MEGGGRLLFIYVVEWVNEGDGRFVFAVAITFTVAIGDVAQRWWHIIRFTLW